MNTKDLNEIRDNIKNLLNEISKTHPNYPDYGYDYKDGKIITVKRMMPTCDNCRHLYYNCDGSVGCASRYEKACLKSNDRKFKETVAR